MAPWTLLANVAMPSAQMLVLAAQKSWLVDVQIVSGLLGGLAERTLARLKAQLPSLLLLAFWLGETVLWCLADSLQLCDVAERFEEAG